MKGMRKTISFPCGEKGSYATYFVAFLVVFVVIAIVISGVGTLVALIREIPEYVTHPIQKTLSVASEQWSGLLKGWQWASRTMLLAGMMVCIAIGVSILVLSLPIGWALIFQGKKPTVFISYHHSRGDVRDEIVSMIGGDRIRFEYFLFNSIAEHDQLLDTIQDGIRRCAIFLCIPGAEPSFVEHEVFAAIQLKKPLIFLVEYNSGRLPNTAQKSYPVFSLRRARARNFASVKELILYLYGDWRAILSLYILPHRPHRFVAATVRAVVMPTIVLFALAFIVFFAGMILAMMLKNFLPHRDQGMIFAVLMAGVLCCLAVIIAIALIGFLGNFVSGLIWRRFSVFVMSRRMKMGGVTYELLRDVFSPKDSIVVFEAGRERERESRWLLASLWRKPPRAHHEG